MKQSSVALVVVILLMTLYTITFCALSIRRYDTLDTGGYDLGNMDQAVWNSLHGRFLRLTNIEGVDIRLAHHVEPILIPISLLYLIYSSPVTLLVLQTVVIALGALPVFWIAQQRLQSDFAGIAFTLAYLLFPALESANLTEFHAVTLTSGFLLYALYFIHRADRDEDRRNYLYFVPFALLAMACKEEIPLLIAVLGLYIFFSQKEKIGGIATLAAGTLWFWIAVYIIIPHFNPEGRSPFMSYYDELGGNPLQIGFRLLTHPRLTWQLLFTADKVTYLLALLAPLAFSSLLAPQILLLALPSLAINLVSGNRWMHQWYAFRHYSAPIVPFIILSAIGGTAFLVNLAERRLDLDRRKTAHSLASLILLSSLCCHWYYGRSPLARGFRASPVTSHAHLVYEFALLIPPEAALSTSYQLNSHLSQRQSIYLLPNLHDAEYLLVDVTPTDSPAMADDVFTLVQDLIENKGFGIVASKDGYILLKQGAANRHLSDDFFSFMRESNPSIQHTTKVNFGDSLQLVGFNIKRDKTATAYLELYWRALKDMEDDYKFFTYLTDEQGKIVEADDQRLVAPIRYPSTDQLVAPTWYPTSQWKVGELVKMETQHWVMAKPSQFGVALGVVEGPGQWEVHKRLRPQIIESSVVLPLLYDGTLVKLVTLRSDGRVIRAVVPRRQFTPPPIAHPLEATLGDRVKFLGYDLDATSAKPGGSLHLTLYWQVLAEMDESYTVFVHLLGGDNRIWGQKDGIPGGGTRPTTSWAQGEIVVDEYDIPIQTDTPPGQYTLEIGMYQLETGQRLEVRGGPEGEGDRILLGKVEVLD
ncbi:MAG: DUF2079 domain-containing protein [Anaerolineales bacterium]|nr:MAG: DUF2079 domain-containing protein [Anaerolineales bacterium]